MKVVWDLGGVVLRWRPQELLARALPQHVTDDASAARWRQAFFQNDTGDWGAFNRGEIDADEVSRRIARRLGLGVHEVRAVVDAMVEELEPLDETVALIERLRERGCRQYFLSNMPEPIASELERRHALFERFDAGVFSARARLLKPQGEIYELAQRTFGAGAHEIVFFDDHRPNVEAARERGWHGVHFTGAAVAQQALRSLGVL